MLRLARSRLEKIMNRNDGEPLPAFGPERFLATADEVTSIASMPEATFALVHFIKPHLPTVFDENGNFQEPNLAPNHEEYFADFRFLNSRFLQMIDEILRQFAKPANYYLSVGPRFDLRLSLDER